MKTRTLPGRTLCMIIAALFGISAHASGDTIIDGDGNINADFGQLRFYFDASEGVKSVISGAASTNGGIVAEWENLATGATLNATTGSNNPTYHTNVINGLPVVRFNGNNDNLLANGVSPLLSADKTIIAVYSAIAPGSACCGDLVQAGNFNGLGSFNDSGTIRAQINRGGAVVQGTSDITGTPIIGIGSIEGTVGTLYVNGTQEGSPVGGFTSTNNFVRLGTRGAASQQFDGDAAEVLIFDGALSTAQRMEVNNYLGDKYAIAVASPIIDEDVTNSNQISSTPFGGDTVRLAGVNFHFGTEVSKTETLHNVGFDNVLAGNTTSITGMDLYGNTSGITLDIDFQGSDANPSRPLSPGAIGDGGSVLNDIASGNRYMSTNAIGASDTNVITFNGLHANQDVFVQLLGGQHGWAGVPDVIVNGNTVGQWTTNTGPANQMSMYGFYATANGSGVVEIDLQINNIGGNFAGIAGVVLHSDQRAANTTVDDAITSAEQVYNNVFDDTQVVAAINFHNNTGSNGILGGTTVHDIAFDDVFIGSGGSNFANLALAANAPGATLSTNFAGFLDRQDNAGATGQDAAALLTMLRDIHSIGVSETHEFTIGGLYSNREVFVQLFGGDAGWSADLEVIVNGLTIGTWTTPADVNGGQAGSYGFYAMTNASGQLVFDLNAINVGGGGNGNFAGISGVLVTALAPTPAALPAGLLMLTAFAARRRRRNA